MAGEGPKFPFGSSTNADAGFAMAQKPIRCRRIVAHFSLGLRVISVCLFVCFYFVLFLRFFFFKKLLWRFVTLLFRSSTPLEAFHRFEADNNKKDHVPLFFFWFLILKMKKNGVITDLLHYEIDTRNGLFFPFPFLVFFPHTEALQK